MRVVCSCIRPHYPLVALVRPYLVDRGHVVGGEVIATRGARPVQNLLAEGWRIWPDVSDRVMESLIESYNRTHRFDWLHTPTFLDDREAHERGKAATAR